MSTYCKSILIACLIALPSFTFAVDNQVEAKPAVPAPIAAPAAVETAVPPAATVQSARIGYVDIARIGSESERGKTVKALLNAKKDALQGKADGKKKQLEKFKTSVEGKIATMTPAQREAKSKEFQKKMEELQKFARASEEEFYLLQEQETKALFEAIEQSAVAHGKANGFAAIVVKKELLYIGSSVDASDVTNDLIKALNQADRKK
ncbi:MAG: OmpH family outer membrane protein [Desulfuromonadaceae bacterium]